MLILTGKRSLPPGLSFSCPLYFCPKHIFHFLYEVVLDQPVFSPSLVFPETFSPLPHAAVIFGYVEKWTDSASLKGHVGWLCLWPTWQLATYHSVSAILLQKVKAGQSSSWGMLRNSSVESCVSGGLVIKAVPGLDPKLPCRLIPYLSHSSRPLLTSVH